MEEAESDTKHVMKGKSDAARDGWACSLASDGDQKDVS